jgi:drug/metabolite transporter (DMT)-like permease
MRENLAAALSIVTAMMILGVSDNFIAAVSERMSLWQYHAMRSALVMPLIVLAMALLGQARTLLPAATGAVLARSAFTVAAMVLYFAAIPSVSVSLAAAGLFTSPIWVTLFSVALFGERVGRRRIAALALGFAGVCLVLQVGTEPLRPMLVAAVLGGAFYALSVIWTRRYCRGESVGALAFWNLALFLGVGLAGMWLTPAIAAAVGHVEGTGFATMAPQPLDRANVLIVLLMGGAGALGILLLARGYRGADPTFAALFDFSFLFWAPLFSWAFWGERLAGSVALGMALIVLAGLLAVSGMAAGAPARAPAASRSRP